MTGTRSRETSDYEFIRQNDLAWRRQVLWGLIEEQARNRPEYEAMVTVDDFGRESRVTYSELRANSEVMARAFVGIGVRPGDGVALWMTNVLEFIYAFFGIQRIGAFVVPINTFFKADEVAFVLRRSGVQHLLMLDSFRRSNFVSMLQAIIPEWQSSAPGQLESGSLPDLRNVVLLNRVSEQEGYAHCLSTILAKPGASTDVIERLEKGVTPEMLGVMLFTSGSTSFPKGVLLEQWGFLVNARLQARRLRLTDQDRWFSMMPFFHNSGIIWGLLDMLAIGGKLVFTEANNPTLALELMSAEQCSINFGVRSMYRDELNLLGEDGSDLECVKRAQTFDKVLVDEMKEKMGIRSFFVGFGMTETYATVCLGDPLDLPGYQEGGWSYPLEGVEFRVVDPETLEDVAPGTVGEALVRGLVMRGYHELPEETSGVLDCDGWLRTKDLVVRDEAGYVKWVGRLKAMLKVGGENVAAEEVEGILRQAPGVLEACVIGVPDDRRGEVPRAYIVAVPGNYPDADALEEWCRGRLAHFKVPRDYVMRETLPMTASGKVDRGAIVKLDPEAKELGYIQS